jgi:hypothetical protein
MRRTHFFLSTAAALLITSTALAQAKPSFAGKWTILPDSGSVQQQGMARGGGTMGGLGEEAVITQDDKVLTITRNTANAGELKTSFNLDGTETYTSVAVQSGSIPLTLKSRWDGNKLVTSIWANVGQQIEIILVYSLDDKGNLVTEHTIPPMGNQQGGTIVTKYKKQ